MNLIIIFLYILQRLGEMWISQKNEALLVSRYKATIVDPNEVKLMKLFHSIWFFSLITESIYHGEFPTSLIVIIFLGLILFSAQIIRFSCIKSLDQFWTVQVYKIPDQKIITEGGLYRFIRHPNYLAVLLEFLFLPLLLGCPFTLVTGFILNLFILKRRILLEESTLSSTSSYKLDFKDKKRFIPELF